MNPEIESRGAPREFPARRGRARSGDFGASPGLLAPTASPHGDAVSFAECVL